MFSSTEKEMQESKILLDAQGIQTSWLLGRACFPSLTSFAFVLYFASSPLELLTHPPEALKAEVTSVQCGQEAVAESTSSQQAQDEAAGIMPVLIRDRRTCSDRGSSNYRGLGVDISQGSWISLGKLFTWIVWSQRPPCRD